jgi:HEAT repeat protein
LARLKDLRALPVFAQVINAEPGLVIRTLTLYNHPDAWKLLYEFAQSKVHIHFRRVALRYLAKFDPAYQDEYKRLNSEADSECLQRDTAFFLGGESNGPIDDPVGALVDRLAEPDPKRRVTAVTLLCRQEGRFPIERVVELLDDGVPEVRANAAYALGLRGTRREESAVQRLLGDPSGLVRYCARFALKRLEESVW